MNQGDRNALWAWVFFDELARLGVSDICVAPGSRSTPLVLGAAADGRFRMYSMVDERSAGYFTLGLGKATGRPAVVVTTSGTAAANLYPAVIEASQSEVPLLVVTADRPHRLRDTDGNQAMDQLRLFGAFPRAFFEVEPPRVEEPSLRHLRGLAARAVALSVGPPRGPVHLNFPFDKPLEPERLTGSGAGGGIEESGLLEGIDDGTRGVILGRPGGRPFVDAPPRILEAAEEAIASVRTVLRESRRGVIVAGPVPDQEEVGPAVLALGAATGFPVLADPLSGARFSPHSGARVVAGYDLFLRSAQARDLLAADLILRVGGSPTSAGALDYLSGCHTARQIVIDCGYRWKDHLACAHVYIHASPGPLLRRLASEVNNDPDSDWTGLWEEAERRTMEVLAASGDDELMEGEILAGVMKGLPEGAALLVASSMPIRDLDAFGPPGEGEVRVFGNRGVSGIDGLVSTALGIAAASVEGGGPGSRPGAGQRGRRPTVGVLGDLAFFHDMNGLMGLRSLQLPLVLVVVNNDGGGIFRTLPVRDFEPVFTKFFLTPHGLDFEKAADLYGIPYSRASNLAEFEALFSEAISTDGPVILEVRTRMEQTHRRRQDVLNGVQRAVEALSRESGR